MKIYFSPTWGGGGGGGSVVLSPPEYTMKIYRHIMRRQWVAQGYHIMWDRGRYEWITNTLKVFSQLEFLLEGVGRS